MRFFAIHEEKKTLEKNSTGRLQMGHGAALISLSSLSSLSFFPFKVEKIAQQFSQAVACWHGKKIKFALASLHIEHNPAVSDSDCWRFSAAISDPRAAFAARLCSKSSSSSLAEAFELLLCSRKVSAVCTRCLACAQHLLNGEGNSANHGKTIS